MKRFANFFKTLPAVTEDIKWGHDLCFLIAGKMFCVAGLVSPLNVSFQVKTDEFNALIETDGIIPAPYMARNKWIRVNDANCFSKKEWEHYISQSYQLKRAKLTKKVLEQLKLKSN